MKNDHIITSVTLLRISNADNLIYCNRSIAMISIVIINKLFYFFITYYLS